MKHTITRMLGIDAGHRVPNHKSNCRNIHGHRYQIEATFDADSGALHTEGAAEGMVTDFGDVKRILMEEIHDRCDHKLIMYAGDALLPTLIPNSLLEHDTDILGRFTSNRLSGINYVGLDNIKLHVVNFIPTAENLAQYWFECMRDRIIRDAAGAVDGPAFSIRRMRVYETPNCFADYSPEG